MSKLHPREIARRAGRSFYRDGVPCRNGHVGDRFVSNTECRECATLRKRRYRLERYIQRHGEAPPRRTHASAQELRVEAAEVERDEREQLAARVKAAHWLTRQCREVANRPPEHRDHDVLWSHWPREGWEDAITAHLRATATRVRRNVGPYGGSAYQPRVYRVGV